MTTIFQKDDTSKKKIIFAPFIFKNNKKMDLREIITGFFYMFFLFFFDLQQIFKKGDYPKMTETPSLY